MNPTPLLVGTAAGAAAALAALLAAGGPDPFGSPAGVAVHVLFAVPLAAFAAAAVGRTLPLAVWFALGVTGIAGTLAYGSEVGGVLEALDAGLVARSGVRVAWCLAFILPWAAAGAGWSESHIPTPSRWAFAAAGLAAACIPTAYLVASSAPVSDALADRIRRQRVSAALGLSEHLCRIGVGDTDLRAKLRRRVAELEREVDSPLPPDAPSAALRVRASAFAQLDRFADAEALLRPLACRHPDAEMLLAAVLQAEGKYGESDDMYRKAIDRHVPFLRAEVRTAPAGIAAIASLPAGIASDAAVIALSRAAPDACARGYDGLAYNARQCRAFDEAASRYAEAIAAMPGREADFRFALGMTYEEADRPLEAVAAYRDAARLDPKGYAAIADARADRLRRELPGCVLGRWSAAGR